jgi:hypothetical protein
LGATIIVGLFPLSHPYRHLHLVSQGRAACFQPTTMRKCVHFLHLRPELRPTPTRQLPHLAGELGLPGWREG